MPYVFFALDFFCPVFHKTLFLSLFPLANLLMFVLSNEDKAGKRAGEQKLG
jgi:hypothetical protein